MNEKGNFKKWAKAAGIRALKTVAQTAIATIGTTTVLGQVDWMLVLSASVLAGLLSVLTSIAGIPEVDGGSSPFSSGSGESDIPEGSEGEPVTDEGKESEEPVDAGKTTVPEPEEEA